MDSIKYSTLAFDYKLARFSLNLKKAYPFLGELIMRIAKYRAEKQQLASTDGYNLYLNEEALRDLPEEALNFVLLHELFHIVIRHLYPKDMLFYEKMYWNIGFDLIANWLIMEMEDELRRNKLPIMPIAGAYLSTDDLSEDPSSVISCAFVKQAIQQGILTDNPPETVEIQWKTFKASIPNDGSYQPDVLSGYDVESEPTNAEIEELLSSCYKSAGNEGVPDFLKNLMDDLKKGRKLPWYLVFKRFLASVKENEDFDFIPPDKRLLYSTLILPGEQELDKALNNALIVIDVSSSVDIEQLLAQIWQVTTILTDLEFDGTIIAFATNVHQEAKLSDKQSLKKFIDEMKVGGGTNWARVVNYVKKMKQKPKPIVVFTDGLLFSFDKGLKDVIFITQDSSPEGLKPLGKVIQVKE